MVQLESDQIRLIKRDQGSGVRPWSPSDAQPRRYRIRGYLKNWILVCVLVVFVLYINPAFQPYSRSGNHGHTSEKPFNSDSAELWTEWEDITPSEKLKWQPCFGIYGLNFQCARLTVPMDYSRPLNESADHPKVHLALLMVRGANRTQDPSTYAETPLLINPGGPGGSGATFVQLKAQSLQAFVGDQNDIIGFDPRGVGASTPKADCFVSPDSDNGVWGRNVAYMNRLTWLISGKEIGLTNSSDVALAKLSARGRAMAKLCQRVDNFEGDSSIFRHMNTPNIARDMLSIVQAWDEWKSSSSATSLLQEGATDPFGGHQASGNDEKTVTSLRGKLVYWGFSYGTFLGGTFASMFPDYVGRMVLDGVVHADRYTDLTWERSLVDADAIWDIFFVYCAEAGVPCSFYRKGDSPEDIRKRFREVLLMLEAQPAIVILPDTNLAALVTASDLKKSVFYAGLYAPIVGFPVIADLLNHALDGTLSEIAQGTGMASLCGNLTLLLWPDDAMRGIACGDKRQQFDENVAELQARFENAASYSWFADVWFGSEPNLGCNGWAIESKDQFRPWSDYDTHTSSPVKTNFPILILSNTLDPVTPLGDALDMTRRFANAYLNDGILPPPPRFENDSNKFIEWPKCECLERPWKDSGFIAEGSAPGLSINQAHAQAYEELRAHLSTFVLSHQLEDSNPLKAYIMKRSGQDAF